jgi:hypothetical protein
VSFQNGDRRHSPALRPHGPAPKKAARQSRTWSPTPTATVPPGVLRIINDKEKNPEVPTRARDLKDPASVVMATACPVSDERRGNNFTIFDTLFQQS